MRPARTILLVEDEPTLQRILGSVLSDAGHRVESVGTAEQALERLSDAGGSDVDLVLSDKNLPAMSGLELLGHVRTLERKAGRTIGFVLVTGYPSRESAVAVLAGDGDGYLVKPFRSLSAAVDQIQFVLDANLVTRRAGAPHARLVAEALSGVPPRIPSGTLAAVLVDDVTVGAAVRRTLAAAGVGIGDVSTLSGAANSVVVAARVEDLTAFAHRQPGGALVLVDGGASFSDLVALIGAGGGAVVDPALLPGRGPLMGRSLAIAGLVAAALLIAALFVYRRAVDRKRAGDDVIATVHDAGTAVPSGPLPTAAQADAGPGPVEQAQIVAARGAVQARAGEKGAWTDAAVGQKLNTDDAVRAGRNAEATLRMGNGVEVRLSPRSEFTIRELTESVSKIRLEEGHVTASVDDSGKRTLKVAARGTDAEAESRGGEFGVVTDGKGQLAVATSTGSVKLSAAGKTVDIGAGQTSAAVSGSAPSAPRAIPSSLFLKVGELGNTKTKETSVTVVGQTDPGSIVKAGDAVARVDDKGHFRVQVPLKDGENTVAVDVTDASGRTKTQSLPTIVVDRKKPGIEAQTQWGTPPPAPTPP